MLTEILLGALICVVVLASFVLASMIDQLHMHLARVERLLLEVWAELEGDEDA